MNTMELVRFVERAEPRTKARRKPAPLFYTELAGPTRQAILRARQLLLSEQRDDGSWVGVQSGDASLPSQLIFLLTYLGDDRSHRVQQAAATILDMQLPSGGWSLEPNGVADVSVSVQAYFALKLAGVDPTDERLRRARLAIRDLGGADAAHVETRYFLALFGQVSYDGCDVVPPELALFARNFGPGQASLSLVWSHRPVREIGVESGIRELFIKHPNEWPRAETLSRPVRYVFATLCRYFERRGWTPLRRRALDRAESLLRQQISPTAMHRIEFRELVWSMTALRAIGHADDSEPMRICDERLDELVHVDEHSDRAFPQPRTTPVTDTLVALEALRASGVAAAHPGISAALRFLARSRRPISPLALTDIIGFLRLISTAATDDVRRDNALPPDIELRDRYSSHRDNLRAAKRLANRVSPLIPALVGRVLKQQMQDGSWGDAAATGAALDAIGHADGANRQQAFDRGAAYLRSAQLADGSWGDEMGSACVSATSLAIRGLVAAGVSTDDMTIAAGLNWLVIQQMSCDGWGEPASATHTSAALVAFVAAGQPNHAAALRAANFLVETQQDHGGWDDPHFKLRDSASGRAYRNELHASAGPLFALSRWAVAAASAQPAAANERSLRLVGTAADS